jgi:hypothetical protein
VSEVYDLERGVEPDRASLSGSQDEIARMKPTVLETLTAKSGQALRKAICQRQVD